MSAVSALMRQLQDLGVTLWHDGERLRYRAPRGALTPELLGELKAHKDAITSFLASANDAAMRGAEAHAPIARRAEGTAPLSFAQERLWFLCQLDAGAAYNVSAALRLRGPLDTAALQRSLDELVRRHAILRTHFEQADAGAVQVVEGTRRAAELQRIDLRSGPQDHREPAARAFLATEAAKAFAFEAAPPVRFLLLQLGEEDHVFACLLHHLVTDGWSMGVMFREIAALYTAFTTARASPLADLPVQYADYAVHQRETSTGEALAGALAYWRAQMAGAPAALDLPLDHRRPAQQSYRGAVVRFVLEREATEALKRCARECNASLFMVLLAGYAALLARYSGQADVVIGTPVANRDAPELELLIGVLSNYIPLRVDLDGDPTVAELIARVRGMTLAGYAHQHLPFEKLVEAASPERHLGVAPLFQAAMVLQNLPAAPLALPGLEVRRIDIDRATSKLDLSVLLEEADGRIRGELEYCTDLWDRASAERMAHHLVSILEALPANAQCRARALPLMDDCETGTLLDRWSGAGALQCEEGVVHQRFRAQAARTPHAIAVVAGGERLTYAELAARVSRLARHLAALDVGTDERVAVCLPRSADLIVALLAVLEAGGAYVPLDGSHPPERLATIVADASARIVITTSSLRARLPLDVTAVCLDQDAEAIGRREAHPLARPATSGQLAYVIYTSGSTGQPKGVMVEHRAVSSLARALADAVYARHRGPVDVALVAAMVFDASVQQIFAALLLGHTLHVVDDEARQSGEALLDYFDAHGIVLSDGTPSLLGLLLDAGLGTRPRSRLEHLLVGGEALPARLIERLHAQDAAARIAVTNLYGPTECGVDDTFRTVAPREPIRGTHVPIGRPLSNARLYILDGDGVPVPIGVRGEIWIGGPCLARGYLGQTAATTRAFRPDPFVPGARLYATGDRGRWSDTGEIEFLGRGDDQVKVRGYRVELGEVESALLRHPEVKDAVVMIDRAGDDAARLVAYVATPAAPTVAALRDHLATLLPAYMVPSAFRVLERFPLNASGKVDRARLQGASGVRELEQGAAYVEPRGPREQALAAAWSHAIGRERIGAGDHFFALGGDSIKALQVVAKVRQAGWRLELRDLFAHPTLAALAPLLQRLAPTAAAPRSVGGAVPLGPVQAAFLQEHRGPKHHFHQALLLASSEPVDVYALNQAIAAVFAHHEALRMRCRESDAGWSQEFGRAEDAPVTQVVDLANATAPATALRTHAAAAMALTDLASGPLFMAVLYRLPDGERLLLAAHHLVIDGVSWRIVMEDLAHAYGEARAGRVAALTPAADSYASWAAGVRDLAAGLTEEERRYWAQVEQVPVASLPVDMPQANASQGDRTELRVALSAEVTARLLSSAHAAYGTRMDDLLLAALGRALKAWTGASRWRVLLESHGREPLWDGADVSRTVGWFTARYPVLLDLEGADEVGRQVKATKEMLRRVPHGGSTYEALRHCAGAARPAAPLPAIAFNYLGQLGSELRAGPWRWVDEDTGASIAPTASLAHDLEIMGFVAAERLQVAIAYGNTRFAAETIARLAAAFERELTLVVEHTSQQKERSLTPSDIDYDGFDIEALDAFVKNL